VTATAAAEHNGVFLSGSDDARYYEPPTTPGGHVDGDWQQAEEAAMRAKRMSSRSDRYSVV
jgi:hypothetical protein